MADSLLVAKGRSERRTDASMYDAPSNITTVVVDGASYTVEPGVTQLMSGHPLAKARPDLFQPVKPERKSRPAGRRKVASRG
jgi:hypothetical protein